MSDTKQLQLVQQFLKKQSDTSTALIKGQWQVRRFCQEDWLLHVRVFRVDRRKQHYEVALFLAEDHWKYQKDSGVKAGLIFALSEAYNKLGKMEIHFLGPKKGGHEDQIPAKIVEVARDLGIEFQHRRFITHDEGSRLYVRLTGISEDALRILDRKGVSRIQACFVVQRSIWSADQIEYIAREASAPERIFDGGICPEDRLCFLENFLVLRVALLSERIQTQINTVMSKGREQDSLVDATTPITRKSRQILDIDSTPVDVFLTPRDSLGYLQYAQRDISVASQTHGNTIMGVTRDFLWLPKKNHLELKELSEKNNVIITAVVDTLTDIDEEIMKRLRQAASTKRALPERPD